MDTKSIDKIIELNDNIEKALDSIDKIPGPIGLAMKAVIVKSMVRDFTTKDRRGVIEPGEMILPKLKIKNI